MLPTLHPRREDYPVQQAQALPEWITQEHPEIDSVDASANLNWGRERLVLLAV